MSLALKVMMMAFVGKADQTFFIFLVKKKYQTLKIDTPMFLESKKI